MGGLSALQCTLVVTGAFLLNGFTLGPIKCVGIFFLPFQLDLGASAKQASLAISLVIGTYFFSGPIASVLCNTIGFRKTMLIGGIVASTGTFLSTFAPTVAVVDVTLSVLLGLGVSCISTPTYALCGQIFTNKRPLVNNIISLGSALTSIPLSLLVQYWIDIYTWRGSMLLVSAIVLNSIPCVMATTFLALRSPVFKEKPATKRVYIETGLLKTPAFPLYGIGCGLQMGSMVLYTTYLVRYSQSLGFNNYKSAALSSIISCVDICFRPILGYVFSLPKIGPFKITRSYLFAGSSIVQSFTVLSLLWATTYEHLVVCTIAYSCCVGFCGALPITVLGDLFGTDKLASSLGLRAMIVGSFSLATPPLVGILIDQSGSFVYPFYVSPVMSFIAGVLIIIVPYLIKAEKIVEPEFVNKNIISTST